MLPQGIRQLSSLCMYPFHVSSHMQIFPSHWVRESFNPDSAPYGEWGVRPETGLLPRKLHLPLQLHQSSTVLSQKDAGAAALAS